MKFKSVTFQIKAIEEYFPVVMFIKLYKVVSSSYCISGSVDGIPDLLLHNC